MSGLLREVEAGRVIVAIDPGMVLNRVWVTTAAGVVGERVSLPTSRAGIERLGALVAGAQAPVFALEATGSLHRAWAVELERRWPGSLRLFAPSQTRAARSQLGTRRFKTDDRDCAALVWLARQGAGQPAGSSVVDALRAAVSHRRQLVLARKPLRQRLHDQLNALAPGLSAPKGHGRALALETSTGRAVLACAVDFAGRPPGVRRASGRCRHAPTGACATRPRRSGRRAGATACRRHRTPGCAPRGWTATSRALMPCARTSPSSMSRSSGCFTGLPEHRDALIGIAWGLGQFAPAFQRRLSELRARGKTPLEARVALARHACRLCWRMLHTQEPYDDRRYDRARRDRGR